MDLTSFLLSAVVPVGDYNVPGGDCSSSGTWSESENFESLRVTLEDLRLSVATEDRCVA